MPAQTLTLASPADGFRFPAYCAAPNGQPRRAGLVILHAMWGVTPHIRDLSDRFAAEGYEVLAPSLMERQDPGFAEMDVDPARFAARQAAMAAVDFGGACWPDVQAAIDALAPPVMLMGFCFGGSAAWVAAAKCEGLSAAACFYGGHIVKFAELSPRCPTILHFGRQDELIPQEDVAAIEARHPDLPVWLYDAGHAFVAPSGYHQDSAELAMLRTRQLFHRASGAKEAGA
jgi:carboxymethylenebutenolidase